jgi:hypothetical protein
MAKCFVGDLAFDVTDGAAHAQRALCSQRPSRLRLGARALRAAGTPTLRVCAALGPRWRAKRVRQPGAPRLAVWARLTLAAAQRLLRAASASSAKCGRCVPACQRRGAPTRR